jgi:hypothetical protein
MHHEAFETHPVFASQDFFPVVSYDERFPKFAAPGGACY